MIANIKKILGIQKTILLNVPDSYPTWHSNYGQDTNFAQKISGHTASKIHAIKSNIDFWDKVCQKTETGNYKVKIVHFENTPDGKKYNTSYYRLEAILSVGYRANSVLNEFITKGFVLDDERLKQGKNFA